ncbi:hypothetical protein Godav_003699 [Gossypium davidsonii]|uniref:Fe2OG dioxygenase domain-containing protein n=1 Tax=Gossypium davidsonii TaxID=34287 RepID=A0A7J8SIK7_GOSDV|nr:hypothetical protein [Gossypium davidsonii]
MEVQEFFNLPMEERKKLWQKSDEIEGFGQAFVVSEEQKLNWGDMFYMITLPTYLRKPHLFPNLPITLSMKLLDHMGKSLGMDPNDMRVLFEEGHQAMRMNYYPPCPQPELVIGLSAHSDPVGLAIVLQINEMEGLQVKKSGVWVPIIPLENAFVVHVGDIMEIVSNGVYPSVEHRAAVNSVKERLSIGIGVADYIKCLFTRELRGKSYEDVLRIQPDQETNTN